MLLDVLFANTRNTVHAWHQMSLARSFAAYFAISNDFARALRKVALFNDVVAFLFSLCFFRSGWRLDVADVQLVHGRGLLDDVRDLLLHGRGLLDDVHSLLVHSRGPRNFQWIPRFCCLRRRRSSSYGLRNRKRSDSHLELGLLGFKLLDLFVRCLFRARSCRGNKRTPKCFVHYARPFVDLPLCLLSYDRTELCCRQDGTELCRTVNSFLRRCADTGSHIVGFWQRGQHRRLLLRF